MSKAQKKTLGELADALREIYLRKKEATERVKAITEEYDKAELALLEAADAQKTLTGKGQIGSFSVSEEVTPNVVDWDAFYKYVLKTKATHLLYRRPAVAACREVWDSKGPIPGVEKFTKRKINLRGV